jgi:AhpD family alkylhydroperoxidase
LEQYRFNPEEIAQCDNNVTATERIMHFIEQLIFSKLAPRSIRYLQRPDYATVNPLAAHALLQMAQEFQVAPPITLHWSNPRLMAAVWGLARKTLVADPVARAHREAIAATISVLNACPYCTNVHAAMLNGTGNDYLAQSLRAEKLELHGDGEMQGMLQWAAATLTPDAEVLKRPPFNLTSAPSIIGTAIVFHYINRMVNVFLDKSPLPIPTEWTTLSQAAGWVFGKSIGRRLVRLRAAPDMALNEPRNYDLPPEFAWANHDKNIASALALLTEAIDEAGSESVDPEVRALVLRYLNEWTGKKNDLTRRWAENAISALPTEKKAVGRLALLTALASYQVDSGVVKDFRASLPADRDLVNVTAWASYAAVRRIAQWVHPSNTAIY